MNPDETLLGVATPSGPEVVDEPQPLDLAEAAAEFKIWHGTPFPGLFLRATDLGERGFGVEAWQRLPSSCEDAPTVDWTYGYIRPPYGGSNA